MLNKFLNFLNRKFINKYDKFHKFGHWLINTFVLNFYYNLNYKFRVYGRENLPKNKPFIIVSNHYSYSDPTIISLATYRANAYIAKKELFDDPKISELITFLGAIPINRENPSHATLKQFKKAIEAGWSVGIFIEGTRNQSREKLTRLLDGASFMAKFGGELDVIPLGIVGGGEKKQALEVYIGKPIKFNPELSLRQMTLIYGEQVAKLAKLKLEIQE